MKYRVSKTTDSPKKRMLSGCSTWSYEIVNTLEKALELSKEWKQNGYYTHIEEIEVEEND